MTDEQIIKALKLCTSEHMGCEDGCPYRLGECLDDGYRSKPMKDALDLINRQKAEIETKQSAYELCKQEYDSMFNANRNLLAEVERLKAEADMADGYADALEAKAKSEAYREFADKLAGAFNKDINLYGRCTLSDVALKINNTLKELTDQTATNHFVSLIDGHIEE